MGKYWGLSKEHSSYIVLIGLMYLGLIYSTIGDPFFWDTIQLGSKHAHYFYSSEDFSLLLPDNIDSGHFPLFGIYLASLWTVFGKSLWISHLAMAPFIIGIIWQSHRLISQFLDERLVGPALLLFLAEPTLVAQCGLISPDVILVFSFLWLWNAIRLDQRKWIVFASLLLSLISMRGMMVASGMVLFDLYLNRSKSRILARLVMSYLPMILCFIGFQYFHFEEKSWFAFHNHSPWAPSFERVGWVGFCKNVAIFFWRMFDFGRVSMWLGIALFILFKTRLSFLSKVRHEIVLFALLSLFLLSNMLIYKGLMGHRYLIPLYLIVALVFCQGVDLIKIKIQYKKTLLLIITTFLCLGHFLVYPNHIAQGWDSSLAYKPYFKLMDQVDEYLKKNEISQSQIGSFFPSLSAQYLTHLNDREDYFTQFKFGTSPYLLVSNVHNDFDDGLDLSKRYKLEKEWTSNQLFFQLWKLIE